MEENAVDGLDGVMSINELAYKHISQPESQNTLHIPVLHSFNICNLIKNH